MSSMNLDNTTSVAAMDFQSLAPPLAGSDQAAGGAFDEHLKRAGVTGAETPSLPVYSDTSRPATAGGCSRTPEADRPAEAASSGEPHLTKDKETNKKKAAGEEELQVAAANAAPNGEVLEEVSDETDLLVAELTATANAVKGVGLAAGLSAEEQVTDEDVAIDQDSHAGQHSKSGKTKAKSVKTEPIQDSTFSQAPDQTQAETDSARTAKVQEAEQIVSGLPNVPDKGSGKRTTQELAGDQSQGATATQTDAVEKSKGKRVSTNRSSAAEQSEDAEATSAAGTNGLAAVASASSADTAKREARKADTVSAGQTASQDRLVSAITEAGARDQTTAGQEAKAAQTTAQAGGDAGSQQVDRGRFVQRVARAFEAVGERSGSVRIRLHPPELGSLRVEITVREGQLTARVETETQTARNLLLDNLPSLRERLVQHDIKIARFDVDYQGGTTGGSPQGPGDGRQSQDRPARRPRRAASVKIEADAILPRRVILSAGEGTQLNVLV